MRINNDIMSSDIIRARMGMNYRNCEAIMVVMSSDIICARMGMNNLDSRSETTNE